MACRPGPAQLAGPLTARWMACTALVSIVVTSLAGAVTSVVNATAWPSADRRGRPGAASPRTWPASLATAARAEAAVARLAGVSPLARVNSTTVVSVSGWPGPCAAASCNSATRVNGAEAGR